MSGFGPQELSNAGQAERLNDCFTPYEIENLKPPVPFMNVMHITHVFIYIYIYIFCYMCISEALNFKIPKECPLGLACGVVGLLYGG